MVVSNGRAEDRLDWLDQLPVDHVIQDDSAEAQEWRAQQYPVLYAPINISRWWSYGMGYAKNKGATEILLLNCDCMISRQGINTLAQALYDYDVSVAGPDYRKLSRDGQPIIRRENKQIQWWERIPGFCMMVRVEEESAIRDQVWPNWRMRWWYSDDWIEWEAREARGTALVPGVDVKHPPGGGTLLDDTLGRYAQEDLADFVASWGCEPCLPA